MTLVYFSKLRKTNIVYDKDAGLSYEIEKAFQSPIKRSNNSSLRSSPDGSQHCCSCLEIIGGRLYTCARCHSSFHSICHYPALPINLNKSQNSDWLCHRCEFEVQYDRHQQRIKCTTDLQEREDALNQSVVRFQLRLSGENGNPSEKFDDFVCSLKSINAREFSLEKLNIDENYYKLPYDELFNRTEPNSKNCFYCHRLVENRMVACDFCSTVFCFDCPNPPFTVLPNERWMCALHIEPFIDGHFLNSMRVTDRIALWKTHTNLPEFDSIRSVIQNFCKKVKEENAKMEEPNGSNRTNGSENKGKKKIPKKRGEKFKVDKLVKEAYGRVFRENGKKTETRNGYEGTSPKTVAAEIGENTDERLSVAVEVLMNMHNQANSSEQIFFESPSTTTTMNDEDDESDFEFNPHLLIKSRPVFAVLRILTGADRNLANHSYLIPIQAHFVTLGPLKASSLHYIDLSQFSSCKLLARQQALIFFDKAKLSFEMVSANLLIDEIDQLFDVPKKFEDSKSSNCGCQNSKMDPFHNITDTTDGIVPLPKPAVLWNGAIIRIGCLRLHFVGLGII